MNKLNTTLVFIAPFLIYLLSFGGIYQTTIGIITYTLWFIGNYDDAHFIVKKSQPGGTD
jgi:hypothetical protein